MVDFGRFRIYLDVAQTGGVKAAKKNDLIEKAQRWANNSVGTGSGEAKNFIKSVTEKLGTPTLRHEEATIVYPPSGITTSTEENTEEK
jgi:hypothetical protein